MSLRALGNPPWRNTFAAHEPVLSVTATKSSSCTRCFSLVWPKWRKFRLTFDLNYIEWESKDRRKDTKVAIAAVEKISFGQKSDKFMRLSRTDVSARSFSLWYTKDNRKDTLDLVCGTDQQFKMWTTVISALVEGTLSKKLMDIILSNHDKVKSKMSKYSQALEGLNVVYRCGSNKWGQLGGEKKDQKTMTLLHISVDELQNNRGSSTFKIIIILGRKVGTGLEEDTSNSVEVKMPLNSNINSIDSGRAHNIMLTDNGKVYAWGSNIFGQLGLGDIVPRKEPILLENVGDLKEKMVIHEIACGADFTAAISDNGVFTWGCGKKGSLGHGDEKDHYAPKRVKNLNSEMSGIACGAHHMLVWTRDEVAYSWGLNDSGQLGLGHHDTAFVPTVLLSLSRTVQIISAACGAAHTLGVCYTLRRLTNLVVARKHGHLALIVKGRGSIRGLSCSSIVSR
eukprot:jgi/Bigna1/86910/estExt_fgenesh1_pg.C_150032